ncbi:MAG: 3D domain-containing protein [Sporomusaceae bacterium]|nr:3D domain-containing protein [Sporomusaceae bacterium]
MNDKVRHKVKRHYKKIAAALGGAFVLAASAMHGLGAVAQHQSATPQVDPPINTAEVQTANPLSTQELVQNIATQDTLGKEAIHVTATAYAPGPHDNDQWGSKTRLGTEIRPGVIAVDPRIIPLGSRVMIQYPDGSKEYAVAEDTGGAIKGNRIDVAKWTVREANHFGIKAVKVYVLSKPDQVTTETGEQV